MPIWFQRAESALVAVAVVVAFLHGGFDWWWLVALFLVWDLSMLGYLVSPAVGAWTYNLAHNYTGPAALVAIAIVGGGSWAAFVGLVWAFHIAVDRLLGYGLKFTTSFAHTHLGEIGRRSAAG